MSFPLFDLYKDLAVAQSSPGPPDDPTKADEVEARTLRRRLAAIMWIPGAAGALALGGWSGSAIVGVAAFAVLGAGLWMFAERGDRLAALIRRSRARDSG
jgi:hypothetical protein